MTFAAFNANSLSKWTASMVSERHPKRSPKARLGASGFNGVQTPAVAQRELTLGEGVEATGLAVAVIQGRSSLSAAFNIKDEGWPSHVYAIGIGSKTMAGEEPAIVMAGAVYAATGLETSARPRPCCLRRPCDSRTSIRGAAHRADCRASAAGNQALQKPPRRWSARLPCTSRTACFWFP
jgi:hypothetical protein